MHPVPSIDVSVPAPGHVDRPVTGAQAPLWRQQQPVGRQLLGLPPPSVDGGVPPVGWTYLRDVQLGELVLLVGLRGPVGGGPIIYHLGIYPDEVLKDHGLRVGMRWV